MGILFLLFTLIPALEIYLLVKVGGQIGALNTLGLLILMGLIGSAIVRSQGRTLMMQAQTALSRGELPAGSVMHGLLVIVGGVLMVTPGFFTDVLGFLFVLPGPRHVIVALFQRYLARQLRMGRVHVFGSAGGGGFSTGFGGFRRGSGPFSEDMGRDGRFRDVTPPVIDVDSVRIDASTRPRTSTDDGRDDSTK
ncbi:MAG: FxsA family protein [Bdellovibrionaceae bacterium]|nr:FxsA family protein [Pseudobdellovibrionaceae bacterium]